MRSLMTSSYIHTPTKIPGVFGGALLELFFTTPIFHRLIISAAPITHNNLANRDILCLKDGYGAPAFPSWSPAVTTNEGETTAWDVPWLTSQQAEAAPGCIPSLGLSSQRNQQEHKARAQHTVLLQRQEKTVTWRVKAWICLTQHLNLSMGCPGQTWNDNDSCW